MGRRVVWSGCGKRKWIGVSLESLQGESPSKWREVGVGLGLAAREADRPGLCPALSETQEGDLMTLLSFLICTMGGCGLRTPQSTACRHHPGSDSPAHLRGDSWVP